MGFLQHRPPAPLDHLIESIWDWDMPLAEHRLERVLPKPGAQLIINLHEDETRTYTDDAERRCVRASGSVLGGPVMSSQIIDSAEQVRVMGVVFRPGGAHALTGEHQQPMLGRDIDLDALFGTAARQLRQRLLETPSAARRIALLQAWLSRQRRGPALDPAVAHVLAALDRVPQWARIAPLVKETGLSEDRFGERFRRHVGMGPKRYARLQRFRAVLVQVHRVRTVDWCRVAADGGFTDQAHLVREFRAFSGLTPTAFMARRGPHLNHLALD
ncbi:helix-turn-helix domain-containing protein [Dyella sp.]|jgi:AraC-like DNA-binding protein|uniref:helix-turn-helix domain-containing protein n=1 Tax=Dyella sp. TaxID=1869338 RepID=UPI002D770BF2|nr:helix-turn-helix domain-containing protein [Dyella sp.]HET6432515.1 helix-turn-helix domain-containing protein [Dyella sp.]